MSVALFDRRPYAAVGSDRWRDVAFASIYSTVFVESLGEVIFPPYLSIKMQLRRRILHRH